MKTPFSLITVFLLNSLTVHAALSPEQDSLQTAQKLKGISDVRWSEIAGPRATENYEVSRGDTLWGISTRLFGDGHYWPKVWALNNGAIRNPHWIIPGKRVAFNPGSGSTLPSFSDGVEPSNSATATDAENTITQPKSKNGRAEEWQRLPKQPWESVQFKLPAQVDPDGFDRRNKVFFHTATGMSLRGIPATLPIPGVGTIVAGNVEANRLTLGDTVFVQSNEALAIGSEWTITQAPELLKTKIEGARQGYDYPNKGVLRITQQKEEVYVAEVVQAAFEILRGDFLIERLQPIRIPSPRPAPQAIRATVILPRDVNTYTTSQHKEVFINAGSDDGIEPGMVFRSYQHEDPSNGKIISKGTLIPLADFLILKTSERFSSALVLRSKSAIQEQIECVSLTDITDFEDAAGPGYEATMTTDEAPPADVKLEGDDENLDSLDDGGELSNEEKKELDQLEKWKENPPESEFEESVKGKAEPVPAEDGFEDFGEETATPTPSAPPPLKADDMGSEFKEGASPESDDFFEESTDNIFDGSQLK